MSSTPKIAAHAGTARPILRSVIYAGSEQRLFSESVSNQRMYFSHNKKKNSLNDLFQ